MLVEHRGFAITLERRRQMHEHSTDTGNERRLTVDVGFNEGLLRAP